MIFLVALATFGVIIYWYFTQHFNYFKKQGIPGPKPVFFFGNYWGVWNKQYHEHVLSNQRKYGKLYGEIDGRTPNLIIAEPDLIRKVFIKDFDFFTNRQDFFPANKYLSVNVGGLKDHKWKLVRSSMSPAFSSAKINKLIGPMTDCAEGVVTHIKDLLTTSDEINIKEITTGYTLDVISSCGLGSKIDSIWKLDNPFTKKALKIIQGEATTSENVIFTICALYPQLTKLLPATAFSEMDFFVDVSKQILKDKKLQESAESYDILGVLLEASKNESSPFRDEIVLFAQVLTFMLAGFDTPATAMASVLHCLGMHQDIQDRVRKDIQVAIKKHGGITHDCVQDLSFLDQCISEAMRLYPTNSKTERICGKTVTYDNVRIEKGTKVTLPIYAIHHDPEIYPEPEKFKPERFSQEEKAKRDPLNFVPFGVGPRSCLGMRLAMEEMKIGLTHLIHNFRFYPTKNTSDPPQCLKGFFALTALVTPDLPMGVEKITK